VGQAENDTNCFKVHFMSVLLIDGYGFNSKNWDTLHIKKKVCPMQQWRLQRTSIENYSQSVGLSLFSGGGGKF